MKFPALRAALRRFGASAGGVPPLVASAALLHAFEGDEWSNQPSFTKEDDCLAVQLFSRGPGAGVVDVYDDGTSITFLRVRAEQGYLAAIKHNFGECRVEGTFLTQLVKGSDRWFERVGVQDVGVSAGHIVDPNS